MSRLVSFIVLTVIVGLFAFLSLRVLASFLLPLFIAVMVVVMFRPLHQWLIRRCHGRDRLAAGLTTLSILVIVLLPLLWILLQATTEVYSLVRSIDQGNLIGQITTFRERMGLAGPPADVKLNVDLVRGGLSQLHRSTDADRARDLADVESWSKDLARTVNDMPATDSADPQEAADERKELLASLETFKLRLADVRAVEKKPDEFSAAVTSAEQSFDVFDRDLAGSRVMQWVKRLDLDEKMNELGAQARKEAEGLAITLPGQILEFIVGFAIMVVGMYYFLADGPAMIAALMRLSPLDDRYEVQLLQEFSTLTRAIIVSMLLAAFVQGLLAGVAYFVVGFESVFLLTVVTMLFAMVPFVGATVIWGGCCLWLFFVDGRTGAAVGLAIYCTLVVSMADNVIKPYVLHGRSNLHPLLGLLSVLGGAKALGPIGLVVGPMVVALMQTLLVMLRNEMMALDQRNTGVPADVTTTSTLMDTPPSSTSIP